MVDREQTEREEDTEENLPEVTDILEKLLKMAEHERDAAKLDRAN